MSTEPKPRPRYQIHSDAVRGAVDLTKLSWGQVEWLYPMERANDLESLVASEGAAEAIKAQFERAIERTLKQCEVAVPASVEKNLFSSLAAAGGPVAMLAIDAARVRELLPPRLQHFVQTYLPARDGGRILAGPTGIGKTLAALSAVRRVLHDHARELWNERDQDEVPSTYGAGSAGATAVRALRWVRAIDLALAPSRHSLGEGQAPLVAEVTAARLLVVDDLGQEAPRFAEVMFEVLDARYARGDITIVTTGLKLDELVERYGGMLTRRVEESRGLPGGFIDLFPAEDAP